MNANRRSFEQWCDYVGGCLDFRPEEGIFRIARDMFTEPKLFDLEMELIFEKNWTHACHENELARPHDFVTLRAERQPLIVTRDGNGQLHTLVNTCQHRGATLVRVGKDNQSIFTYPSHVWCYENGGRLAKAEVPDRYPEGFNKATCDLKKVCIQSYRGFAFVSLGVAGEDDLVDLLGNARVLLDMLVAQLPNGEPEMLPGISTYTYEGNWKLQSENGLDDYHVSTVHYNYVATVQRRQQVEAEHGGAAVTLDYSRLGAGNAATDDDWFFFINGHSMLFSETSNPAVRPGYANVMPRLVAEYGQIRAKWTMHRLRNLNLYPSPFVIDQISSQLRIVRPLAWNRTETVSRCINVKGESDADRENWIRQPGDLSNVSGMDMSDDLMEFHEVQHGFQTCLERWSDIFRGRGKWFEGVTPSSQALGIVPLLTGTEITHEGLYANQHAHWRRFLLGGLERPALRAKEVTL